MDWPFGASWRAQVGTPGPPATGFTSLWLHQSEFLIQVVGIPLASSSEREGLGIRGATVGDMEDERGAVDSGRCAERTIGADGREGHEEAEGGGRRVRSWWEGWLVATF